MEGQGYDTYILEFSELTISSEVSVIPVFNNPVGLTTRKRWCFRQGATLLWPLIFAGLFRMLDDCFGKR